MTTSKPIATISYNTADFLKEKLDKLIEDSVIDFYSFVRHSAEEDESKDHFHLYMVPSSKINTNFFRDFLSEPDLKNPEKPPLGVLPFCSSKFDDWYLYSEHNEKYLASKMILAKYHYTYADFVSSDNDYFYHLFTLIDRSKLLGLEWLSQAVNDGISFQKLVALGRVPVQLISQYYMAYNILGGVNVTVGDVERNGRVTHTPLNVDENGEIIDISKERFD